MTFLFGLVVGASLVVVLAILFMAFAFASARVLPW